MFKIKHIKLWEIPAHELSEDEFKSIVTFKKYYKIFALGVIGVAISLIKLFDILNTEFFNYWLFVVTFIISSTPLVIYRSNKKVKEYNTFKDLKRSLKEH